MENKIIYIDLCEALSEIFVDNEVDIKYISSVAKKFPIEKVEYIFFEWVAPVCYTNPLTPAPSVWAGYDKQELWDEICAYQTKKKPFNAVKHKLLVLLLKSIFKNEWLELKKAILS